MYTNIFTPESSSFRCYLKSLWVLFWRGKIFSVLTVERTPKGNFCNDGFAGGNRMLCMHLFILHLYVEPCRLPKIDESSYIRNSKKSGWQVDIEQGNIMISCPQTSTRMIKNTLAAIWRLIFFKTLYMQLVNREFLWGISPNRQWECDGIQRQNELPSFNVVSIQTVQQVEGLKYSRLD